MEAGRMIRGTLHNPTFEVERLEALIRDFELRPSDVFVCGYMRSGSTLTQQILHLLRHGGVAGGVSYRHSVPWLEATCSPVLAPIEAPGHSLESLRHVPPGIPRFFKTHAHPRDFPGSRDGTAITCRVLYVARDPKDVAVSQYHHVRDKPAYRWRIGFPEFLERFLRGEVPNGSWFDHVQAWSGLHRRNPGRILFLRYEDLVLDPAESVNRIGAFLGLAVEEELLSAVIAGSRFEAMKADPSSRLGFGHFRKGVCGGWRDHFTEAQRLQFEEVCRQRIGDLEPFRPLGGRPIG